MYPKVQWHRGCSDRSPEEYFLSEPKFMSQPVRATCMIVLGLGYSSCVGEVDVPQGHLATGSSNLMAVADCAGAEWVNGASPYAVGGKTFCFGGITTGLLDVTIIACGCAEKDVNAPDAEACCKAGFKTGDAVKPDPCDKTTQTCWIDPPTIFTVPTDTGDKQVACGDITEPDGKETTACCAAEFATSAEKCGDDPSVTPIKKADSGL
jgi:hypothetical protein